MSTSAAVVLGIDQRPPRNRPAGADDFFQRLSAVVPPDLFDPLGIGRARLALQVELESVLGSNRPSERAVGLAEVVEDDGIGTERLCRFELLGRPNELTPLNGFDPLLEEFVSARLRVGASIALQAPVPIKTISMGRAPRLRPPTSGDASSTIAWPLPLSATNVMPSTSWTRAFMAADAPALPRPRRPATSWSRSTLQRAAPAPRTAR